MNKSYISLILLLIMGSLSLSAQTGISIKESSKKLRKKYDEISKQMRSGELDKALKSCDKIISKNPNITEFWVKRGSIFFEREQYALAEKDFNQVYVLNPQFDSRLLFTLALSQYQQDKYTEAASSFERYLATDPQQGQRKDKAARLVEDCKFAAVAVKNPVKFEPKLLGDLINTSYSEYYPVFTLDQKRVVFTRNVKGQEDFYYCEIEDSTFTFCEEMYELNTPLSEGVHCLAPDGNMIIYTACHIKESYGSCDLFYSTFADGHWSKPNNLGTNINGPGWESQPSLSGDGQELYFASKRTEGYGGSDIYRSRRDKNGKWSLAENLGPTINTSGEDGSPSLHPDHQTLYFRSNGRPGMGDFDIYYSKRNFVDRQWQEPINIGYPINTKHDDGALTVNLAGNEAYFTSDRAYKKDDPNRNLDIYRFVLDPSIAPVSSTYIRLQVIDKETKKPLVANIKLVDTDTQAEIINLQSQVNSKILFSMPVGGDYALVTSKEGYVYHSEHIPLTEVKTANIAYEYVVELEKIPEVAPTTASTPKVNKAIVLNNIFFESGEAVLLKRSDLEINYLVDLMKEQPTLKIKIIGHTDDVGSEADNLKLSQDRAAAVVAALINKGIANIRLQSEGLGESSPIADNQSKEGRKQNRRTEFLIL